MSKLIPMTQAEYDIFFEHLIVGYAADKIARVLYESLGYRVMSMNMAKPLE